MESLERIRKKNRLKSCLTENGKRNMIGQNGTVLFISSSCSTALEDEKQEHLHYYSNNRSLRQQDGDCHVWGHARGIALFDDSVATNEGRTSGDGIIAGNHHRNSSADGRMENIDNLVNFPTESERCKRSCLET